MGRGQSVSRGPDRQELDLDARPRAPKAGRDLLGLAERQLAPAGADTDTATHLASTPDPSAAASAIPAAPARTGSLSPGRAPRRVGTGSDPRSTRPRAPRRLR